MHLKRRLLPLVEWQLQRPLDFTAVTDHAEYLGEINLCTEDSIQGRHKVMNIATGEVISHCKFTSIPMPPKVIKTIHLMATKQGMKSFKISSKIDRIGIGSQSIRKVLGRILRLIWRFEIESDLNRIHCIFINQIAQRKTRREIKRM